MASNNYEHAKRNSQKRRPINAPFGLQLPSSLRDPRDAVLSIDQLERLRSVDQARDLALGYLHDHEQFASIWNTNRIHPETRRFLRKLVQMQTLNAVGNGFYRLPDGTKVDLNKEAMRYAAENTRPYDNDYLYHSEAEQRPNEHRAQIFVVNGDCLDTVMCFKKQYPTCHPVVLNMASANNPGGGWRNGAGAQEENLHRRTNLFQCLEDPYRQLEARRSWQYRVPEFGGIYSPNVCVFRGAESNGYPFFPDGAQPISFIACAAYSHPPTENDKGGECRLSGKALIHNMKRKMEAILKIALENKHDVVILSALGCGAYRNPPRHIAQLFHEVISQSFSHSFKYIVFAIIDDHNAMKEHNPIGNVQPFAEVFHLDAITVDRLPEVLSSASA